MFGVAAIIHDHKRLSRTAEARGNVGIISSSCRKENE